ncbi:hypothetical protein EB796_005056 [Bugula neritina]|uniref:Uncharacterized protein n=1 Tax=Bugula neritina TaxID=10212 RepID=A0A7J7KFC9_BUGNE|nr:hypothetical protein EB796_005056 [Bugula neritina]
MLSLEDSCDSFTADPINCYNKASVYDGCCESCDALVRQDLPPECPWGDKELWCTGITEDQCEDTEVFETCCDQCGPHLTTTTATTTTIVLTTTSPCIDTRDNCANLTSLAIGCYDWADECCSSCKDQVRDHLGDDCRFGDKFQYCSATPKDDCDDTNIASECCELCGPAPPTTEASTTTEGTTTSTTT